MRSFENKYGRNRELYTPRAAAIRPPSLHVPDAARRSIGCRLQDSTKDGVVLYPSGRGPNRHRTTTKPLPGRSPRALKCPALTHTHARNQRIPTRALLPGVRSCSDRIKTKLCMIEHLLWTINTADSLAVHAQYVWKENSWQIEKRSWHRRRCIRTSKSILNLSDKILAITSQKWIGLGHYHGWNWLHIYNRENTEERSRDYHNNHMII